MPRTKVEGEAAQPHVPTADDLLRRARSSLRDPNSPALLVVGPPGSGKSHLLARLLRTEAEEAVRGLAPPPSTVRPGWHPDLSPRPRGPEQREEAHGPRPVQQGGPRLVVGDDADQLDGATLAQLAAAVDADAARLVLAVRASAGPGMLRRLRPLRPVVVLEAPPWQRQDLAAWVRARLDAPLHEATAARLLAFSGGNALCLTELLEVGSRDGLLVRTDAVRHWSGPLQAPPRTVARLSEELDWLPRPALDVLAALALAGELDLLLLEQALGGTAVEQADDAGLLTAGTAAGPPRVRLREAAHVGVLLATTSYRRRVRLARALAEALPAQPRPEDGALLARLVVAGADAPTTRLLPSLRACLDEHDTATAAAALSLLSADDDATRALRAAVQARQDGPWPGPVSQEAARVVDLVRTGRLQQAVGARTALPELPRDEDQLLAHLAVGVAHATAGIPTLAQPTAHVLRAVGATAPWPAAHAAGALIAGLCALTAARPDEAVVRLAEADVSAAGTALALVRPWARALLTLAHVLRGDAAEELGPAPSGTPGTVRRLTDLARAEALQARGLHQAAADAADVVVAEASAQGERLLELLALRLRARARADDEVASRLEALAASVDLPQAGLWAEHARAAAASDTRRLHALADQCRSLGLAWAAAETAALAARCAGRSDALAREQWWRPGLVRLAALTERERQIAELVALGMTSAEIAARLHVSRRTVDNHLQHSYRKLGISRRQDLALALALRPPDHSAP